MGVCLTKGQKVSLTKGNPGLKDVVVGLGWDSTDMTQAALLIWTQQRFC